ncbi:molecular chaperone SurA [Rhodoferax sp. TH121]|uniref:peptidylprolyl isomerase n=1 Tax=Rhodoferax sp. TH121 TaxID=2022803 RepID=UPI000B97B4FA|nr:peptidylprolyl isomerase [Rhodoferax sp. TH121]OYQ38684.1 molecular chaperone SurA [Rhodoferax sp. TH121]
MKLRLWAIALACACGLAMPSLHAQTSQPLDYIVALVNSEPITHQELEREIKRVAQQIVQQGQAMPPAAELRRLVLERMINDRAQLQLARETGIRIDVSAIDRAEQAVATQNEVDVAGLHQRLTKDGVSVATFRNGLRDQLMLNRLHEREVESTIKVSDVDVDRAMQTQLAANTDPLTFDINLAQILVAVPEKATAEQAAAIFVQAKRLLDRIRAGEDFDRLVKETSAADRNNGGQLGLRRADRYPLLFVEATQALKVGEVSEVVRSGAGFHILKVIEKRAPTRLVQTVVQSRARHVLLRSSPQLPQAQAIAKLADARQRIMAGKTDFAAVARSLSQDTSAEQGGDLGWASPGMFVPEFEEAMNALKESEISQPVVSRFGVHLIQLMERRRVELSPQQVRESVRSQLRRSRYDEAYRNWAQDVRGRAYVEMREPPQ